MKTISQWLHVGALTLGILGTVTVSAVEAARLGDGRIFFDQPPTLVEATTLEQEAGFKGQYHFVVEVPANAGEPLGAIAIIPRDGAQRINFKLEASRAQQGAAYGHGPALPLASVGGMPEDPNAILVVFDQPVPPGETVTVTLQTSRNPSGGVYLFGVTGYPAGDRGEGQFLGYGRINIYDSEQ